MLGIWGVSPATKGTRVPARRREAGAALAFTWAYHQHSSLSASDRALVPRPGPEGQTQCCPISGLREITYSQIEPGLLGAGQERGPGAVMLTFGVKQNLTFKAFTMCQTKFCYLLAHSGVQIWGFGRVSCSLSLITPTALSQQPGQKTKDGNWIFLNPAIGGHLDL